MDRIVCFIVVFHCVFANYGPLPDNPFHIIWQVPTGQVCQVPAIEVSFVDVLEGSGILFNKNDSFEGGYSTILYRGEYGYWPHYLRGQLPAMHGGIPQEGNFTAHLERAASAIETAIPNKDFHGVACINMEQFRPLWQRNWGDKRIYQQLSRKKVETDFSHLEPDKQWVEDQAIKEFQYHAKRYMAESLRLSRRLRPYGKWGYYHFPYCFNTKNIGAIHCRPVVQEGNDQIKWLWEESTAIMPSIYVFNESWSLQRTAAYMYANIHEGFRVGDSVGGRPVYVYHKMKWNMTLPVLFYDKVTLYNGMRLSADFGADGVIMWGSQADFKTRFDCQRTYDYVKRILVPYAKILLDFTKRCSQKQCSNLGRCVHRGTVYPEYASEVLRTTVQQLTDWTIDDRYLCRCYPGHTGTYCDSSVNKAGHNRISTIVFTFTLFFYTIYNSML